jgi:hypothetical protein
MNFFISKISMRVLFIIYRFFGAGLQCILSSGMVVRSGISTLPSQYLKASFERSVGRRRIRERNLSQVFCLSLPLIGCNQLRMDSLVAAFFQMVMKDGETIEFGLCRWPLH